jgi:hypothetical protein
MSEMSAPECDGTIAISWSADGLVGRVSLEGEQWAPSSGPRSASNGASRTSKAVVSRTPRRRARLRGDCAGRNDEYATGALPTPEEARAEANERRSVERMKRANRPSEQKRRTERWAGREALSRTSTPSGGTAAQPPYEILNGLSDAGLWKSNSSRAGRKEGVGCTRPKEALPSGALGPRIPTGGVPTPRGL